MSGVITTRPQAQIESGSSSEYLAWFEIFATWALIEATIWTSGKIQFRLFWIATAFVLVTTAIHRPRLEELGLGLRGLRSSLWVIPAAIVLASLAVFLASTEGTLHPLFGVIGVAKHSIGYGIWAVFQQFLLQSYFFLRFERLLSTRTAALLSPGLFCFVHIPNPVLIGVCIVAGWVACEVFRRHRNIYALGVAHAILGLTIAVTVPNDIQRHMRVGIGYYHYQAQRTLSPHG